MQEIITMIDTFKNIGPPMAGTLYHLIRNPNIINVCTSKLFSEMQKCDDATSLANYLQFGRSPILDYIGMCFSEGLRIDYAFKFSHPYKFEKNVTIDGL